MHSSVESVERRNARRKKKSHRPRNNRWAGAGGASRGHNVRLRGVGRVTHPARSLTHTECLLTRLRSLGSLATER